MLGREAFPQVSEGCLGGRGLVSSQRSHVGWVYNLAHVFISV